MSKECQDLYIGGVNITEDNTGAKTTVKKGDGEDYSHTLLIGVKNFMKKDDGASCEIEGGEGASLAALEAVGSDVKIQESESHTIVRGKGGEGTKIASKVVHDSKVSVESHNKVEEIRRDGKKGEIVAEVIATGNSVVHKKETNSKISVTSK